MNENSVVTRFAPSPTGQMHIGGYRTAFFAYLFAKKNKGKFILRIENTDKERSKKEYTEEIFKVFDLLGINYDEKYIQSENLERHKEILQKLIENGHAYISKEEAKDGSGIIKEIVRFKNPQKKVTFVDLIRGKITTDTIDLGDFVIAKNLNEPLFHLAVVVDDHDEGVTHIIRAEEHISNTPRQILIYEALGFNIPNYAHLPIVLAEDKSKLSKRKGAVPVVKYLEDGYLPEALLNAICLCGWNPGTDQEIFSREELERIFDLEKVQKSGAVFSEDKLNWFNREYIKKLSSEEFWSEAIKFIPNDVYQNQKERLYSLEQIMRDRIEKFSDIETIFNNGEIDYFFKNVSIDPQMLIWKSLRDNKDALSITKQNLSNTKEILNEIKAQDWNIENIKKSLAKICEREGNGNILWPMRVALSGREKSPDPFEIANIIGKDETIEKISKVISSL